VLLDGKVIGGQAIGRYADTIGFFIAAMWRKDDMARLKVWLATMTPSAAAHAWPSVQLASLMQTEAN
jgi:NADH oxidase (H2O2-forming)